VCVCLWKEEVGWGREREFKLYAELNSFTSSKRLNPYLEHHHHHFEVRELFGEVLSTDK
jgi:hypothetical protein